jgi:hypothetical protein
MSKFTTKNSFENFGFESLTFVNVWLQEFRYFFVVNYDPKKSYNIDGSMTKAQMMKLKSAQILSKNIFAK